MAISSSKTYFIYFSRTASNKNPVSHITINLSKVKVVVKSGRVYF